MNMDEWGEQPWIDFLKSKQNIPAHITGIGDDCAVFPKDNHQAWLLTTDSLVEGVHFKVGLQSPQSLGQKLVHVNLSDVAAMGGQPCFAWLNTTFPKNTSQQWLQAFSQGVMDACNEHQVLLLGGDTTASHSDLFFNFVLLGEASKDRIKYRSGSKADDILFATGPLGFAKAGLELLEKNQADAFPGLTTSFQNPTAQLQEGQWLSQHSSIHSLMDCSDGLFNDLPKLLAADKLGAHIELDTLVPDQDLLNYCHQDRLKAIEYMICGGEDYCLIGTVEKEAFTLLNQQFQEQFGYALQQLGSVQQDSEIIYLKKNQAYQFTQKPFLHFTSA